MVIPQHFLLFVSTTDKRKTFSQRAMAYSGGAVRLSVHPEFCPRYQEEQRESTPRVGLPFHHLIARPRTREKRSALSRSFRTLRNACLACGELGHRAHRSADAFKAERAL